MSNFDKIETKVDKIQEDIGEIKGTLAAQHESLKTHIKRTDLLEQKLAPLEKHVTMVHGGLKVLGLMLIALKLVEGFLKVKNG